MKKSDTRTEWLLVKAGCCSEFDSCDYALINITPEFVKGIESTLDALKKVQEINPKFTNGTFITSSVTFYTFDPDNYTEVEKLAISTPCFVELDEDEELNEVSEYLDILQIKVYPDGSFFLVGYGKFTNTEYYTETLEIKDYL